MHGNVGGTDRFIRITLGLVLLSLVFLGPATPLGWLGLLPLITGLTGFCPLYSLIGISTKRKLSDKSI